MMLKGAANTARFKIQHIHPTKVTLLAPWKASRETSMTNPNPPTLNMRTRATVNN